MYGTPLNRVARLTQLLAITLIAFTTASANAATANLDDLILGNTLNLGSVTISNFTEVNSANTGVSTPVDPSKVVVNANLVGDEISLDFLPIIASANQGGTVDYDFSFVINSTAAITDVMLVQIGNGPGSAFVSVDETVGGVNLMTNDSSIFAAASLPVPATSVTVEKSIKIRSTAAASAQISGIQQTYVLVPEMNAMGLAMFALIGCLGMSRKSRR